MNPFTKHPHTINETYVEHFKFAFKTSCILLLCGLCGIVHAIFPFLFTDGISKRVRWLHNELSARINAVHDDEDKEENLNGLF